MNTPVTACHPESRHRPIHAGSVSVAALPRSLANPQQLPCEGHFSTTHISLAFQCQQDPGLCLPRVFEVAQERRENPLEAMNGFLNGCGRTLAAASVCDLVNVGDISSGCRFQVEPVSFLFGSRARVVSEMGMVVLAMSFPPRIL